MNEKLKEVIYIAWIEPARGLRPTKSGCSLHLSENDSRIFAERQMRLNYGAIVYFQPQGSKRAYVTDAIYQKIIGSNNGYRLTQLETDKQLASKDLILDLEQKVA